MLPQDVLNAMELIKAQLGHIGKDIHPPPLREAVRYYLEMPGKLLRPLLLFTFSYSLDRRSLANSQILQAAIVVELLHVVSLLQDDVMDKHNTRRGVTTPRVLYGDDNTVLASDWLIAEAIKRSVELGPDVVRYLAEVAQRLAVGQALDLQGEQDRAAALKTAPLIEAALVMPTLILNRRELMALSRKIGESLGILYQYSDDYSDENIKREEMARIADEIRDLISRLRSIIGDAILPFEKLVKNLIDKALEGTITTRGL